MKSTSSLFLAQLAPAQRKKWHNLLRQKITKVAQLAPARVAQLESESVAQLAPDYADAPEELKKSIKYDHIPVILLGRLAIDKTNQGQGIGKKLLVDSLERSLDVAKNHVGSVAVIVDPIDDSSIAFYSKYGFTMLPDSGRMFMTIKKIDEAFNG